MPGTEQVNKQRNIGGTLGIVLLLLALAYRFFPGILHVEHQQQVQTNTSLPASPSPWRLDGSKAITDTGDGAAAKGTTFEEAIAMGPPAPVTKEVAEMLKAARKLELDGSLFEPPRNNAVGLYRQVLQSDPGNRTAEEALRRIGGAVRDWSFAALERGDEAEAERYAEQFASLPHSETELTQLRERLKTLRKVMPMLSAAAELLKRGRMLGEGDNNALAMYRKVLAIDPNNHLADEGLARIEQDFLERALGMAAQNDLANADAILAEASSIRPGSQALDRKSVV